MWKREKLKFKFEEDDDDENASKPEIMLGSSDDEEGNEDLSSKIVEKALLRCSKAAQNDAVLNESDNNCVDPSSSREGQLVVDQIGSKAYAKNKKRSKREKKKKLKGMKIEFEDDPVDAAKHEECAETAKSMEVVTSVEPNPVETSDNIVLRKLLRGPRYFDPPDSSWGTCFNCGEEGHTVVNCTALKRKKPCFVCGSLEHGFRQCSKVQDCFICKKGGHRAKDCPEKQKGVCQSSKICLRCGHSVHDMFSCRNDYSPEDIKEIQCYVCKSFGHLCCVNSIDTGSREVSCYKCGQLGHIGLACARLQGESSCTGTPSSCYKCGDEGHFARECTNSSKACARLQGESIGLGMPSSCYSCGGEGHFARECLNTSVGMPSSCYKCGGEGHFARECLNTSVGMPSSCYKCGGEGHYARECLNSSKAGKRSRELSTPSRSVSRGDKTHLGFKSELYDLGKARKKREPHFEERVITPPRTVKQRGGWIMDDPGDFLPHFEERVIRTPPIVKRRGGWTMEDPGDLLYRKSKSWRSPATPTNNSHRIPTYSTGGHISGSLSFKKIRKHYSGASTSQGSAKGFSPRFSTSRFGNPSSNNGRTRNYDWW